MKRLVGLGHRELRYLRSDDDAPSSSDREKGVLAAAPGAVVVRAEDDEVPGLIEQWRGEGVTAVIVEETDTGSLSAAALAAVDAAGLRTPDDLSLAVLGQPKDHPEVSGFEVPRRELGRRAVRLLVDQITGSGPRTAQHVLLDCLPVDGSTIGPR